MPKLSTESYQERANVILESAERCFARNGIHRTTMHDICREAGVSPGALYGYFASKEALIVALCERERLRFVESFRQLAAAEDLMAAFDGLARQYLVDEPAWKRRVDIEMGIEGTRNEKLAGIFHEIDAEIRGRFSELFENLIAEGRIAPDIPAETLANIIMVLGDGLYWRRAIHPDFDVAMTLPAALSLVAALLKPVPDARSKQKDPQ